MTHYYNYWNQTFFIGTLLSFQYWPSVPSWKLIFIVVLLALFIHVLAKQTVRRYIRCFIAPLCFAMAIITLHSNLFAYRVEGLFRSGNNITIIAEIDSFFSNLSHSEEYLVTVNAINSNALYPWGRPKIKLSVAHSLQLANSEALKPGEIWQLEVKIKPVYGRLNQAGFDAEKYFISQGWQGKAAVQQSRSNRLLAESDSIRYWLYQNISHYLNRLDNYPILLALTFGERREIDTNLWQQLKQSGLIHLVAISGLHIGIAFMLGWWIGKGIRYLIPSGYWLPLVTGVAIATAYAWLAGFSLPTVRALIMCLVLAGLNLLRLHYSIWLNLMFTLSIVLLLDPFASLASSFWLSFASVAAIYIVINHPSYLALSSPYSALNSQHALFALSDGVQHNQLLLHSCGQPRYAIAKHVTDTLMGWAATCGRLFTKLILLQLGITLCMLPLSAYLFSGIAPLSMIYNLIFVPWFSFMVIPLLFVALLLTLVSIGSIYTQIYPLEIVEQVVSVSWQMVDLAISPMIRAIEYSGDSWLSISYSMVSLVLLMLAIYFIRPLISAKLAIFTLMLGVTFWGFYYDKRDKIHKDNWQITVLDIGHGLAVLISKNQSVLLYDTGSRWLNGSIAESVIEPVLRRKGVEQLDMLIVSHMDLDHAGGKERIEKIYSPAIKRASQYLPGYQKCKRGEQWLWQGLTFTAIWPPKIVTRAYNPHSCVIQISDGVSKVLLTGDIDQISELLIARDGKLLQSDVVIVPHHGSQTSSSAPFVQAVKPKLAIASLAKGNRWGLPNPKVVKRYRDVGASWLDTGEHGQITLTFSPLGWRYNWQREEQSLAWYRHMIRKGLE